MSKTGIGPILASTKCKYKVPLTFPDKILVGARTSEIKEDRFVMQYAIVSRRLQKIAAEGEAVLVSYSYREGKKAHPSTKAPIHKPPKSDFLSPIQLPGSNTQRRCPRTLPKIRTKTFLTSTRQGTIQKTPKSHFLLTQPMNLANQID